MTKEINNSVSSEATVSATKEKDYAFDVAKFNLLMKHKTLEKFQDYIERVSVLTDGFKTSHKIAFNYEENWREKWVNFITEKYGCDESVVKAAVDFYDEKYLFWDNTDALIESEEYGNKNGYIVDYVNTFDKPDEDRLYVVGKLDVNFNPIHRIAKTIRERAYVFEQAVYKDIVEFENNRICKIPFDYFRSEDVEVLKNNWDGRSGCVTDIFKKIDYIGLIDGIYLDVENSCVIVKYIWGIY